MSDRKRPFFELCRKMIAGEVPPPPIAGTIGMSMVSVGDDAAVFEMDAGRKHTNPMGTVHGGIFCDLADGAMGMAWSSGLEEGETFTTLELKMNFLKPVWQSRLRAEARVIRRGKTIGLVACDVRDEKGDLVAHATSTVMTLRGDQAKNR